MRLRTRLLLTLVAIAVPLVAGATWLRADSLRRAAVASLVEYARTRMDYGGRESCEASPATFQDPPMGRMRDGPPPDRARDGMGRDGPDGFGPPPDRVRDGLEGPPPRGPRGARGPGGPSGPGNAQLGLGPNGLGPGGPGGRRELFAYAPDFASANTHAPKFPAELRSALESGAKEASDVNLEADHRTTTVALRMSWNEGPAAIVLARRIDPAPPWGWLSELSIVALVVGVLLLCVVVAVGPIVRRVRELTVGVRRSAESRYAEPVVVEGRDEIAELGRAFNDAGAQVRAQLDLLEKRERTLRSFVENTTHDVMLPLTVLQGHLTRLRNELQRGATPERSTVREALEESHYLASLVQNLGAAAKLEAGEPELRRDPISWNQIVERVVLRHRTIAAEKGVELDFAVPETDVRTTGDVTLVEQALSNVVHNAVRYNKPGGHVAILLDARDGRFVVRVFDDGPGVPDSELARLAERSYRSDEARVRHPDGMGLGLAIAQHVAERHGFEFALRKSEAGGLEVELSGALLAP